MATLPPYRKSRDQCLILYILSFPIQREKKTIKIEGAEVVVYRKGFFFTYAENKGIN